MVTTWATGKCRGPHVPPQWVVWRQSPEEERVS